MTTTYLPVGSCLHHDREGREDGAALWSTGQRECLAVKRMGSSEDVSGQPGSAERLASFYDGKGGASQQMLWHAFS